jgi:hypothetical protein
MKGRNKMSINTRDMEIVHRAFRRESRLLTELVAAVDPGDTARAKVIADHFRDYRLGLKNHHEGEDELLWPPLAAVRPPRTGTRHLVRHRPPPLRPPHPPRPRGLTVALGGSLTSEVSDSLAKEKRRR